jgi:hypothetical protein
MRRRRMRKGENEEESRGSEGAVGFGETQAASLAIFPQRLSDTTSKKNTANVGKMRRAKG